MARLDERAWVVEGIKWLLPGFEFDWAEGSMFGLEFCGVSRLSSFFMVGFGGLCLF